MAGLIDSLPSIPSVRRFKMEALAVLGAWAMSSVCSTIPSNDNTLQRRTCEPRHPDVTQLANKLSPGATISFPGESDYNNATNRWSTLDAPTAAFVVVPVTENDVVETVKYANNKSIPFLAVNGGHGAIITQGKMKRGIEIWLDKLNTVQVNPDGKSATIGGGTLSKKVTDTLWNAGKQTVTGGCECTSIMGPGLGGGHGFMQGRHGLITDQFLSVNIVDAEGTLKTVTKASDPDLWWGIQGAGHNFGIVTSVQYQIYDITHKDWAYQSFIFTGDKVEGLYQNINDKLLKNGTQPVDVINYSFFFNFPDVDPKKPVIMFFILQEGVKVIDPAYTQPFVDLGPASTTKGAGSYTDLPTWTGNANESPPCQKVELANIRFPIDLDTYNIAAQRQVYDLFALETQRTPALNGSLFLFEGYSTQGVKAVADESTAFPFRSDNLLVAPLIIYKQNGTNLDRKAARLGENLRQILHKGSGRSEMHTYVNYAYGDETTKNWYGSADWRQTKLKQLKAKYDPKSRFSFYAPIA